MASGLFPFKVRPASLVFFVGGWCFKMGDAGQGYRFQLRLVVSGFVP